MSGPGRQGHLADLSLAARDPAIPGLACLLDDDGLSALLGEAIRVTRVRYKPHTSALVAFTRDKDGPDRYGWAMATAPGSRRKLQLRADNCAGIRFLHPDPYDDETVVAVGGLGDDWPLRKNLLWLRLHGPERLQVADFRSAPGTGSEGASVLRYKPERRLVVRLPSSAGPVILKTAAQPYPHQLGRPLRQRLLRHGVPVLPELADASCARHGVSASPAWGNGDLRAGSGDVAALRAGEALAALHHVRPEDLPLAGDVTGRAVVSAFADELFATRSMVAALLPELEVPAVRLAATLLARLGQPNGHRPVVVHGDFSPDQVLVAESGIRIIDFDRIGTAEPAADIGSFAAAEEVQDATPTGWTGGAAKTRSLLEGYCQTGAEVSPERVQLWAAYRLFRGSVEPFRDRAGNWPAGIRWHLRRAQELIA